MPHLDTEFEQRRRINQAARSPEAAVAAAAEAGGVTQGWGGSRGTAIRSGELILHRIRMCPVRLIIVIFSAAPFSPFFYDTLRGAGSAGKVQEEGEG